MSTCHGTNRKGKRCQYAAPEGAQYCRYHRPVESEPSNGLAGLLNPLLRALGPIGAWIGGGIVVSAFGYLSKHLYLSGFGIRYAQFAGADDLVLDATAAVSVILPVALLSALIGWATFPLLKRWVPVLSTAFRASIGASLFAASMLGWHVQSRVLEALISMVRKLAQTPRKENWLDRLMKRRGEVLEQRPRESSPTQAGDPLGDKWAVPYVVAVLCLIASADLLGRYGASRLAQFAPESCAVSVAHGCASRSTLERSVASVVYNLGSVSQNWLLSPTPRLVRFIGANDQLPASLRGRTDKPESEHKPLYLYLVDRNTSFLFLRACTDELCSDGKDQGNGIVLAADAAKGISFAESVGDSDTPKPPDDHIVHAAIDIPGIADAAKQVAAEFAKLLSVSATSLATLNGTMGDMRQALKTIPHTITTTGNLNLTPKGSVDLKLSADSIQELSNSLIAVETAELRSRYRTDRNERWFQDCVERRRLTRNLLQRAKGSVPADASDCLKGPPDEYSNAPEPGWVEVKSSSPPASIAPVEMPGTSLSQAETGH